MKFKSQVFTQASGSVGGLTYSRNKGGLYTRARTIPVNPQSSYQVAVRALMAQLSGAWGTVLTPAQRSAWNVYASNVSLIDKLGDPVFVSGFNHYIRSNVPRLQAGLARVDDAPTVFDLGIFTPVTAGVLAVSNLVTITFDINDAWVQETDSSMIVYAGRSLSPTINFFKGPYRQGSTIDGDITTPPTSPATFTAPFVSTAGNAMYARVQVSRADGRLSTDQVCRMIAV